MITNEDQYKLTQVWVQRFQEAIAAHDRMTELRTAERDAMVSQLEELLAEVRDYEARGQHEV